MIILLDAIAKNTWRKNGFDIYFLIIFETDKSVWWLREPEFPGNQYFPTETIAF